MRGNGSNSVSRLGRQPPESLRHRRGLGWSRPARLFRRSSPANTPRVVQVAIFEVPLVGIATGRICCHESVGGEPWLRSGTIFTAPHRPEFVQVPSPTGAESLRVVANLQPLRISPRAPGTTSAVCTELPGRISGALEGTWHLAACCTAQHRRMASPAHCAAGPGASEARAELLTTGQDRRAAHAGRGRAAPPFS